MWLGSVLASCGSAQPLLLALMDNGGSPRKKGNAYTVLCCQAFARAVAGTFGWRGGLANMCGCILRGLRHGFANSLFNQMQHNN